LGHPLAEVLEGAAEPFVEFEISGVAVVPLVDAIVDVSFANQAVHTANSTPTPTRKECPMPHLVEYSDQDIKKALAVLAGCAENYSLADTMLKDLGIKGVGEDLLRQWRRQHAAEYNEIRKDAGAALRQGMIDELMHRAALATQVVQKATEKALARVNSGADTNPAKTAELMAKVADVNLSKAQLLQGQPTEIKETRTPLELVKFLEGMKVLVPQLPEGGNE
jgi:hypothetical protein